jgi:hypothetical protein
MEGGRGEELLGLGGWAEERWPAGRRLAGMEEKWAACGAMVCGISCAATLLFSLNVQPLRFIFILPLKKMRNDLHQKFIFKI